MQNEETNNLKELEQLRSQYCHLKNEIDKQQVINEKILKASMKNNMRIIDVHKWIALAIGILFVPVIWFVSHELGLRPYFHIVAIALIVIMVVSIFLAHNALDIDAASGENTLIFIKTLKKNKKLLFGHFHIFYPAIILLHGLFIMELIHFTPDVNNVLPIIFSLFIAVLIGSIIGFRIHKRIIDVYDDLILHMEKSVTRA